MSAFDASSHAPGNPRVLGFIGHSGAGKTTLIEQLLPRLRAHGLRVSLLKHTHHDFDLDQPGKDSARFRAAGAQEVLLVGGQRWALLHEAAPPPLVQLLGHLSTADLVLVEGWKREPELAKIEIHRPSLGKPLLHPEHSGVVAVASDAPLQMSLPLLNLNDPQAITDWLLAFVAAR